MTVEQVGGRVAILVEAADRTSACAAAELVADGLRAEGVAVFRASAHDFVRGTEIDRPFLRGALVEPFLAGQSFPLVGSRWDDDVLFDPLWTSAPAKAYLVLDCGQTPILGIDG
jgi:hypothetical protein